jgi:hypothetical protein
LTGGAQVIILPYHGWRQVMVRTDRATAILYNYQP